MKPMWERTPEEVEDSFVCLDCGFDTKSGHEYYTVYDEVWLKAHPDDWGMLCIGCLEERLGRPLTPWDFPRYPVNDPDVFRQSDRLRARLGYGEQTKVAVP